MKTVKTVEAYIENKKDWKEALVILREIMLSTKMEETIKWGSPVYTVNGKNVAGISAFKSYVGIWFFQGALLKDTGKKLMNAQEGVTKALRQWRFASVKEIKKEKNLIRKYLAEAIINQEQGKEIKPAKKKPLVVPDELKEVLKADVQLQAAFDNFTHSKKREFAEHISEAKRPETKQKRLDKITPMILNGIGLHDKYKK